MDNIYVPNFTFSTQYLDLLISYEFDIEVHFMVQDVIKYYLEFKKYKIKALVFHPSVLNKQDIEWIIHDAKQNHIDVGLAININESFKDYLYIFHQTTINLIMGVNAGFGGQTILNEGIEHLKQFKQYLTSKNLDIPIIFDGGINNQTIHLIYNDANIIVSGSYLMKSKNLKKTYLSLLNNKEK